MLFKKNIFVVKINGLKGMELQEVPGQFNYLNEMISG